MQHLQPNTTLQGGKYRIERVLGQGGFGNTYVGYNTEFEETVAIKEFFMKGVTERDETTCAVSVSNADNAGQFEEQREKFKKEARRLRKLKSEHIVKVHDLFEENGTAYYVMDFIDGESLAERMKRTGKPMSESEVRAILPQILEALKEVHQNEIWHLDLKPGNVMIDKDGNAYLIDFGASKQILANGSMTTSTALCYTPGYAPNEQIGQMYDRFGPWTDIYALGATIYNLLTNKKPPMAIDIEEDEEDAFEFPTSISEDMRKLVVWMMQPKRKSRPQCVDEITDKLETVQEEDNEASVVNLQKQHKDELNTKSESESEETLLIGNSGVSKNIEGKTEDYRINESEEPTILVVSKKDQISAPKKVNNESLPTRAIKVGDFIYDDGSYSDKMEDKKLIGVLFSYLGGAHGQILSVAKPNESLSINGKELKWHEASISEWVELIENLGHCKVYWGQSEYKYFSEDVHQNLINSQIKDVSYITKRSISGLAYKVDLLKGTMVPVTGSSNLPFIYISEF